jgi:hypothetical protein
MCAMPYAIDRHLVGCLSSGYRAGSFHNLISPDSLVNPIPDVRPFGCSPIMEFSPPPFAPFAV